MRRDWLTLTFGLLLVAVVVVLSLRQNMTSQRTETPSRTEPAASAPPPAAAPSAESAAPAPRPGDVPAPSAPVRPRISSAPPRAEPPASVAETAATLHVASDVPGASVFLDRQFVGTTPLTLANLEPGRKQLNVTATGHEGYAEGIDLAAGANRVTVEFLKVRLNASVPVVHKHAMGSCQGTLTASANGIVYRTTNKDDGFTLPLAQLDEFEVDYLKKNLKVKRRGGRTWNFTNANADALFVFHRDVAKARERVAAAR